MNANIPNPSASGRPTSISSSVLRIVGSESGLVNILLLLARFKWIVIPAMLVGGGIGLLLAVVVPRSFAYSTTLEVGSVERESTAVIESPDSIISKITTVHLPAIEREYGTTIGQSGFVLGLEVKNPRNTNLVVLTSKGPLDEESTHRFVQGKIVDCILADHRDKLAFLRTNLTLELEQSRRQAESLKDQAAALVVRRTLLEERRSLTTQRIEQIENDLARVINNRELAGKSLTGQDQVLTLMMLDLQLVRERDKSMDLKRELAVGLAEERDRITREEADLARSQKDQDGRIAAIQARISNIDASKLVGETQRSQKAVSFDPIVVFGVTLVLGAFFGIMLAVCAQAILAGRASASLGK